MLLADKIIRLRKKNGWSQEELAEKMRVSRQAVSKWEGAQTVPDLEKILMLSSLFGVTTDYLLKDEIEDEEFTGEDDCAPVRRVSLAQASDYLAWRAIASKRIAAGTFLCVIAAIPLLILSAATQTATLHASESSAAIGMTVMLVLVAAAVALFIHCGAKNAPYDFLDKEPFETEYGVTGMARERQKAFRHAYTRGNVAGACLCVLAPIPLFLGACTENGFARVVLLSMTMILAGAGACSFIVVGVRWASMQKLLREGEFAPGERRRNRVKEAVARAYWLTTVAVYLGWSLLTDAWKTTWIVWPIAGILFAVIMCLCNLLIDRDE